MSPGLWVVYLGAVVLLSLTPGPNGLLAVTHGARYGVRRCCYTISGGVLGFVLLMLASMIGLGGLLAASELAFAGLKLIGAGYLIWLGIRQWRSEPLGIAGADAGVESTASRVLFLQGFWVAIGNPKVILFFLAFLPQFVDPERGLLVQMVVMGFTFAVVEFVTELLLACGARRIIGWFRGQRGPVLFNRVTGATFVVAGALLAGSQR